MGLPIWFRRHGLRLVQFKGFDLYKGKKISI